MEEFTFEIIMGLLYLVGMPIIFGLFMSLHKTITRRFKLRNARSIHERKILEKDLPPPLSKKMSRRVGFTMKQDTRPLSKSISMSHRAMFFAIWALGLITVIAGAYMANWQVIVLGFLIFFVAVGFSSSTAKKVLDKRDKIERRVYETVNVKMAYGAEGEADPKSKVRITKWENFIEPRGIECEIPVSFSPDQQQEFMRHFNNQLSFISEDERSWVPDFNPTEKKKGWDYGEQLLTLRTVPPLPGIAMFHEDYILGDRIAWSFFPLGLAVSDGVEVPDPENPEEMQNVVGIDLSGAQKKLGKDKGFYVSDKLERAPQVFIGGGTGGGKSLKVSTLIPVVRYLEDDMVK